MTEFKKTFLGGMRAETWNWTFPFVTLTIKSDLIQMKILGFEKFRFTPDQVVGFKKRKGGFQIFHNVKKYPPFIIFWGNSQKILNAVQMSGFTPSAKGKMDDVEYQMHHYLHVVGYCLLFFILVLFIVIMIFSN